MSYHSEKQSDALAEKTFLITGSLDHYGRKELEAIIMSNGGKILSGVSKALDYLIVGQKPGSKLAKAEKLGSVRIITEAELLDLLEQGS
jgi:DNA ligase (NAD+)